MIKNIKFNCSIEDSLNNIFITNFICKNFSISKEEIKGIKYIKKSIDARRNPVKINLDLDIYINENKPENIFDFKFKNVSNSQEIIIIGAGPAGLFAALQLIELGLRPIIIERGKQVKERRRDLADITKKFIINPDSNYCFGEGGAGTYSDGKLYTRSTKRGNVNKILKLFVFHGADEKILFESHPHIGTNKLPQIIEAIRNTIINYGGKFLFQHKVTDFIIENKKIKGIQINNTKNLFCKNIILATGHSARDIFYILNKHNINIENKEFAIGVRIEHKQELIDKIQYKCEIKNELLPPSNYSIVEKVKDKGVFSFCMCPGGIVAPAATSNNEIVVNGWSPSKRNNIYANSGLVVNINKNDFYKFKEYKNLAALQYQKEIEQNCYLQDGINLKAPAQRIIDFIQNTKSIDLPKTSYLPGLYSITLEEVLPKEITLYLKLALQNIQKKMPLFITNDAILIAPESRTSSPVRIPRDKTTLEHIEIKGLFPCGEGAGYAGGIISAAIDGVNCATAIFNNLKK